MNILGTPHSEGGSQASKFEQVADEKWFFLISLWTLLLQDMLKARSDSFQAARSARKRRVEHSSTKYVQSKENAADGGLKTVER
jgi:hypothetical protein